MSDVVIERTAAELRAAFDASFAEPAVLEREGRIDVLAIQIVGEPFALRVDEISWVLRCPPLEPVPSRNVACRGLVGIRGTVVAVYSLATLVGGHSESNPSGWIVVCGGDRSAALLFDELSSYERVDESCIVRAESSTTGRVARDIVRIHGVDRTFLSIPSLLTSIRRIASTQSDEA